MPWSCGSCGGDNPDGMRFCGHCGTPAVAAPPPAPQAEAPQAEAGRDADVAQALRSFVSSQVADKLLDSGGEIAEERRLVTCLFADISGFTPLADKLDPEELLEVIDPVINRLSSIVGRYEGYVDKFAGDALLAFFGAPVAHEDDGARALLVALEMHRELERMLPDMPPEARDLTLHVGVNSGHVVARVLGSEVRMDYSVLGDAVILAQRLESAAPAGETYVGQMTHVLTRGRFDFESVGELTLKGKAKPVTAWRLVGEKRFAGRPLERTPFVGRSAELRSLTQAFDRLSEGRGGVISVTGDAGVGKSRLIEEARHRAEGRGIAWFPARCISYGSSIAYWPYLDLIRRLIAVDQQAPVEEVELGLRAMTDAAGLSEWYPYLARLLGLPAPELSHLDPEDFRRRLHEAFEATARRLAAAGPVVLAVEDVHWADASSIALTARMAALGSEIPLMTLVTARPDSSAVVDEIAASVDHGSRSAVSIEPFDDTHTEELIQSVLDGRISPDITEAIRKRSAGNALYVQEMVRSLQDEGQLLFDGGRWVLAGDADLSAIPPTLEGIVSERIDRLPRSAATTLQIASVIGRRIPVPLLAAVAERAAELPHDLAMLSGAAFVDQEGDDRFAFRHALIQDVAYSRLLRRRRRALHLKVADAAERLYGAGDDTIDLLARHLYIGRAGRKAIDYLTKAGERARRLFANEEAVLHFGRAAELARAETETKRLPEILLNLGDLNELMGRFDDAFALYSEAKELGNDVHAWRGMASTLRHKGEYQRSLDVLDEAFLNLDVPASASAELWLEKGWTLSVSGRYSDGIVALQEGLRTLPSRRDPIAGHMLLQLARNEVLAGRTEDGLRHGLQAQDILEEHGDLPSLSVAFRVVGGVYLDSGRLEEASVALTKGLEIAERTGKADEKGNCLLNLGLVRLGQGRLEEALRCDRRAVDEFERIGHGHGRAQAYSNLAEVLMYLDKLDEALVYVDKALELAADIGYQMTVGDALQTKASIRLRQERYSDAASLAEQAADVFTEMNTLPFACEALGIAAEALEKTDDKERARDLLARARFLESEVG